MGNQQWRVFQHEAAVVYLHHCLKFSGLLEQCLRKVHAGAGRVQRKVRYSEGFPEGGTQTLYLGKISTGSLGRVYCLCALSDRSSLPDSPRARGHCSCCSLAVPLNSQLTDWTCARLRNSVGRVKNWPQGPYIILKKLVGNLLSHVPDVFSV